MKIMNGVWNLIDVAILKPIIKNITLFLCFLGVICILTGALLGKAIDEYPYIPTGTGHAILNVGSAILGAGVFAAIMKSLLFIEVFQKHIFDVLYTPYDVVNLEKLREKWIMLTEAILKNTLPISHRAAANSVLEQFLDQELQYHFEELDNTYDIEIASDNVTVKITHTTVTKLVVSPNYDSPVVTQQIKVRGKGICKLVSLRIDDEIVDVTKNKFLSVDANDPDITIFTLPLKKYLGEKKAIGDRVIKLERTSQYFQNLIDEPYIVATFSRYVKTCGVKAKINTTTKTWRVIFKKSGIDNFSEIEETSDHQGYKRWVVAKKGDLLLPGQGYILIIM